MVQASDMGEPPRESPVQLVFLVLAHENPIQLARLLRAIEGTCARIFVHIDGSRSIAPFRQATTGIKHVEFLDGADRIPVFWAGFSMVQATLNLMRRAREQVPGRARFCLLSGMDYPIKDSKTIQSALASDKEFIRIDTRLVTGAWHLRHVRFAHFMDFPGTRIGLVRKLVQRIRIPRAVTCKIPLYWGSQWWALSGNCMDFILSFVEQNPDYSDFHRHTFAPDEIYFHSIVKSSPFPIFHDVESASDVPAYIALPERGIHFIDWVVIGGKPRPKTMELQDLERLLSSPALFTRKCVDPASTSLLDALDKRFSVSVLAA
jgi:hypothetical protein